MYQMVCYSVNYFTNLKYLNRKIFLLFCTSKYLSKLIVLSNFNYFLP